MNQTDQKSPKLMLIIGGAFGELFHAMYFIMGWQSDAVFALVSSLITNNHDCLPGKTYEYRDYADLIGPIENENPDLVILFSGYVPPNGSMKDLEGLSHLIDFLVNGKIRFVTTDCFLGLSNFTSTLNKKRSEFVSEYVTRAKSILKDAPHLYFTHPGKQTTETLAFYNPHIHDYATSAYSYKHTSVWNITIKDKYWLFILGDADYVIQVDKYGSAERFHNMLSKKMNEASRQGRRAVLIGSPRCIEAMKTREPDDDRHIYLNYVGYNYYMEALFGAEYVFYWNAFSASVYFRLLNALPVFFFDHGHVAYLDSRLLEKGIHQYYCDISLVFLSMEDPLHVGQLEEERLRQERQLFPSVLANARLLPTPEKIVYKLLA